MQSGIREANCSVGHQTTNCGLKHDRVHVRRAYVFIVRYRRLPVRLLDAVSLVFSGRVGPALRGQSDPIETE